jgi:hypothetical protein
MFTPFAAKTRQNVVNGKSDKFCGFALSKCKTPAEGSAGV